MRKQNNLRGFSAGWCHGVLRGRCMCWQYHIWNQCQASQLARTRAKPIGVESTWWQGAQRHGGGHCRSAAREGCKRGEAAAKSGSTDVRCCSGDLFHPFLFGGWKHNSTRKKPTFKPPRKRTAWTTTLSEKTGQVYQPLSHT